MIPFEYAEELFWLHLKTNKVLNIGRLYIEREKERQWCCLNQQGPDRRTDAQQYSASVYSHLFDAIKTPNKNAIKTIQKSRQSFNCFGLLFFFCLPMS